MTKLVSRVVSAVQTRPVALLSGLLLASVCAAPALANKPDQDALGALVTLDLSGQPQPLFDAKKYRATALVFMSSECPISRQYVPELNRMAKSFAKQPVRFLGVISDRSVTREAAAKFAKEFRVEFPVMFDASGELADLLQPTHVPQAFVLDGQGAVVYRGRINDQYATIDKRQPVARNHELRDALTALVADKEVATAETTPVGCKFEGPAKDGDAAKVTFTRDIAPILFAKCSECHRPGEVAPFTLLSYDDASKRADFLSDVTSSRLMPPWKAEAGFGHFMGERRLTDREIELFAAWAKAGAPEGDAADLPPQPEVTTGWRLGEPDLVLQAPASFDVPADGKDVFQHIVIPIEIPEDKTLVGWEFHPGNPAVVHHAIFFLDQSGAARKKDAETPELGYKTFGSIGIPVAGLIGVWTPGMTPRFFPDEIGMPLKTKTDLVLQLHIHPTGKAETDQSSLALYFTDKPIKKRMAASPFVVGSILIDIPAGSDGHTLEASVTLPCDVTFVSLLPHMHLIGKEMKITATLPNGEEQPMIWIKDWNFFWQDNYVYREPMTLPKGTTLSVLSRFNNSAENPLNPSTPPKRVLFGNDSDAEMCFGIFQVVAQSAGDEMKLNMALTQSFMKQLQESKIAPDARAVIIDEAMKLFGGGGEGFIQRPGFSPGGKGGKRERRAKERDEQKQAADAAAAGK